MTGQVIKVADPDAQRHPTKVAVFSAQDIPEARSSIFSHLLPRPAVEVDGVVMNIRVSAYVRAGTVLVVDQSAFDIPVEKMDWT